MFKVEEIHIIDHPGPTAELVHTFPFAATGVLGWAAQDEKESCDIQPPNQKRRLHQAPPTFLVPLVMVLL